MLRTAVFLLIVALSLALLADLAARILRERRVAAVLPAVQASAREFDVPAALVLAVIEAESDFHADARSAAGALGLMQLMPETFSYLGEAYFGEALPEGAIFDPTTNIRYGTYYLSYLFARFGAWREALAAYNAGEGRVAAWLKDPRYGDGVHLLHVPFGETAHYLTATEQAFRRYSEKYNFEEKIS